MEVVDAPALQSHLNERRAAVRPASRLMGLIAPLPLLAGVLIGFAACCVAGYLCGRQNPYRNFSRFHTYISPDTYFYPTASQFISLARGDGDKSRITVIIGGNSILQGTGQKPDELWTIHLQEVLGDRYRVMNLATRGGAATEGAAIAADLLRREGYPVVYVTSIHAFRPPFMDGERHYSQFWDAWYKGDIPLEGGRATELNGLRAGRMRQQARADQPSGEETLLGQRLDSWFFFNDLWTTVGYKLFFTVWLPPRPAYRSWVAREDLIDPEGPHPPVERRFPQRDLEKSLEVLRALAEEFVVKSPDGSWTASGKTRHIRDRMKRMFSDALRPATIVILVRKNPYFIRRLNADEQEQYKLAGEWTVDALRQSGHASALLGASYTDADYADWLHLVVQGGRKLAEDVAPLVRRQAESLGYDTREARP